MRSSSRTISLFLVVAVAAASAVLADSRRAIKGYSAIALRGFTAVATRPSSPNRPAPRKPGSSFDVAKLDVSKPVRPPAVEYDVYIALDVSQSTKRPAGSDVNGDGRVGRGSSGSKLPLVGGLFKGESDDPGDSVLAVEVKAAKRLIEQLDAKTTRVGIIAFSGTRAATRATEPDARVVAPLTRNYDEVVPRLDALLAAGPRDEANLMAAVQLVTAQFKRGALGNSQSRRVKRIALLISDGPATLPALLPPRVRATAAVEAAQGAAQLNARIYTYSVGAGDGGSIKTLQRIAEVTRGEFEKVGQPSDLVSRLQGLDLAAATQ